jgi:hypothetical protein
MQYYAARKLHHLSTLHVKTLLVSSSEKEESKVEPLRAGVNCVYSKSSCMKQAKQ